MPSPSSPRSRGRAAALALCLILPLPGAASPQDWPAEWRDNPHLQVIRRTEKEGRRIRAVTRPATAFSAPEKFEKNSAGAATVRARPTADAFSQPSANMSFERELDFKVGDGFFRRVWISAPSSTQASDGLGPLFNARACQRCHLKDGRGHPPQKGEAAQSMFLRISVPADPDAEMAQIAGYIATAPEPRYGGQLQNFALPGIPAEGKMGITYTDQPVTLADNTVVTLRKPHYAVENPGYGPLAEDAMLSPRVAPQMIGMGMLEAIPADDILAGADPDDVDGDGISGRPNLVWSRAYGRPMLGRFGHKAGVPTIRDQVASAFHGDIGLSSPLYPTASGDCTPEQTACLDAPDGNTGSQDGMEVSDATLDLVSFYSRNLAVPARRDVEDPQVLRGKQLFYDSGCTSCHRPKFVTARLENRPEQSFQLIWPYTDMLLHDMGPGLADDRPEARATGRKWRTAPLWGVGLTERVSGHTLYLHDGRARSLLEAILWHGGEAETTKQRVMAMPEPDRNALIRFLGSL
ncbi:MAG: di-heme oxidoredictase family protein [Paracoccaceae bacterium]